MNWAFELLGLSKDADELSVKRAYARLLRTTRPDEDPDGFQRLNTAYKMVLAHIGAQTQAAERPIAAPATEPGTAPVAHSSLPSLPSSVVNVTTPAINLGVLANDVIHAATEANQQEAFLRWLQDRPEFWSVQVKQQTGQLVLHRLFKQPQAMSSDALDALLHFFDLDHVLSGINPMALKTLRKRQMALWEWIPANHRELARRMRLVSGSEPDLASLKMDIALLERPFSWRDAIRTALQVNRPRDTGRLVQTLLVNGRFDELPPSIDRQHAYFWYRAASTGGPMTWERFAIGSLRVLLIALLSAVGIFGVLLISAESYDHKWMTPIISGATIGAGIVALWILYASGTWFDQWQGQPESAPSRWPWLRRLAVPALCVCGLLAYASSAPRFLGYIVAFSFIIAVRRFRRRTAARGKLFSRMGQFIPAIFFVGLMASAPILRAISNDELPVIPAAAFATFCVWAADMWFQRTHLRKNIAHR